MPAQENVIAKTDDFLLWFLPKIEKFPRNYKFLFGDRLVTIQLRLLEQLIEAYYRKDRLGNLRAANLEVEKLRHLLKLCASLKFISLAQLEFATRALNEIGSMIGGWLKHHAQQQQQQPQGPRDESRPQF